MTTTIEIVKQHLAAWMAPDTWNTSHPLDVKRFHQGLHGCFEEVGPSIDVDEFRTAMIELLNEYHPTQQPTDRSDLVNSWVQMADAISTYLYDNDERA